MKHSWLKITLLLCTLFVASCGNNCDNQCRRSYNDGYRAGKSYGYDRGHDAGHKSGYREGYTKGENDGYRNGYLSGSGAYVSKGTLPLIGITILTILFLITVYTILRVFRKPLVDFVRQYGILLRSKLLLIQSNLEVKKYQKLRDERARIIARTLALEVFLETESLAGELNLSSEYIFILRSVEERLYSCIIDSLSEQSIELLSLMKDIGENRVLMPSERKELADILYNTIHSEAESAGKRLQKNLAKYGEKSDRAEGFKLIYKELRRAKVRRIVIALMVVALASSLSYLVAFIKFFPPLF